MNKPEILAPAGSMESLKAAVTAGADAVYMGGSRFGARAYADNPKEDELIQAIEYCHLYGRKLYMTVNTLFKQQELEEELISYLTPYVVHGVDAVIVQDLGVLRVLEEQFPMLPVHASTQMSLMTGHGASLFGKQVTRVVPARELTLSELSVLRQTTDKEIEVFVHGALCYCYSGQCLFSSMCGERSGNRGRCAQPCRLLYELQQEKKRYILSPRELCGLKNIPDLVDAGVDSFKIEGRMKKPAYVALTTALYRKYTDACVTMDRDEYSAYVEEYLEQDYKKLLEIYNRNGFTAGYYTGDSGDVTKTYNNRGTMLSDRRPKHGGVCVGKVIECGTGKKGKGSNRAKVQFSCPVDAGDVVEFRDENQRTLYEYTVGTPIDAGKTAQVNFLPGSPIRPGNHLYRTRKSDLIASLEQKINEKLCLGITGRLTAEPGKPLVFTLCYEPAGCRVEVKEGIVEAANKLPATKEQVSRQLNKLGGTEFVFEHLDICLTGQCFLPSGVLNELRRRGIGRLREEIIKSRNPYWQGEEKNSFQSRQEGEKTSMLSRKEGEKTSMLSWQGENLLTESATSGKKPEMIVSVRFREQFQEVVSCDFVDKIYLWRESLSDSECGEMIRQTKKAGKEAFIILPWICREAVYRQLERELESKESLWYMKELSGCVICNLEELELFTRYQSVLGKNFSCVTNYNVYVWNNTANDFLRDTGVDRTTLPLELSYREMKKLNVSDAEMLVYGHIPLMVSAQCIRRNYDSCGKITDGGQEKPWRFTDRKNHGFFALNHCRYCYNTIYDGEIFSLFSKRRELEELHPFALRMDLTVENPQDTRILLEAWKQNKTLNYKTVTAHFDRPVL